MRSDRVLGKIEMFVNDWLVQLGQGINPQVRLEIQLCVWTLLKLHEMIARTQRGQF